MIALCLDGEIVFTRLNLQRLRSLAKSLTAWQTSLRPSPVYIWRSGLTEPVYAGFDHLVCMRVRGNLLAWLFGCRDW